MSTPRVTIEGLSGPVDVFHDRVGVPHIRARSQMDAYFAQGYVVGKARLWQLDLYRRTASGRLAECFGASALAGDRFQRALGLLHLARAKTAMLEPDVAERLEAYARGVNRAAETLPQPLEFRLLGTEPEPWTVSDALLCAELRAVLNASWRAKLVRLQSVARAGAAAARDLFVDYELPDGGRRSLNAGADDGPFVTDWLDAVRDSEDALRLAGLQHSDIGTNTWVVDGSHTRSGKPLLANDLHMGLVVPNPNFLVHLQAPGLHVRGICFPGAPGVLVGHNERIAWGSAAFMADAQDLFLERLDESGSRYRYRGEWLALCTRSEEIRGGDRTETLRVDHTHHGPLIKRRGRWGLALRWERLDGPPGDPAFHSLGAASDWESFRDALRGAAIPPTDFTYADTCGNIGAQSAGFVPLRSSGDGALPALGWTGDGEWTGYVPFDELPSTYRPSAGRLVRSNHNHPGAGRYFFSRRWHPPYRAERVQQRLAEERGEHTVQSFSSIQLDRHSSHGSFLARRLLEALAAAPPQDPALRSARDLLAAWNGRLDPDSAAASLVKEASTLVKARLLGPRLGKTLLFAFQRNWPAHNLAVEWIFRNGAAGWLPPAGGGIDAFLREVFADAVDNLRRWFDGGDPHAWRWGRRNAAHFAHPLGGTVPSQGLFRIAPVEVGGDGECVFSARGVGDYISSQQTTMLRSEEGDGAIFGVSARLVLDPSDWDSSSLLLNLGQSGDPHSPHFTDQLEVWRSGGVQRLPFSRAAMRAGCTRRLRLSPPQRPGSPAAPARRRRAA